MPGMPDKISPKRNGHSNGARKKKDSAQHEDIKVLERRILSSTEHLNEILELNALLSVASTVLKDIDR